MKYNCTYDSPVGTLHLVSDGEALIAATFRREDPDVSDSTLDPLAKPFAAAESRV